MAERSRRAKLGGFSAVLVAYLCCYAAAVFVASFLVMLVNFGLSYVSIGVWGSTGRPDLISADAMPLEGFMTGTILGCYITGIFAAPGFVLTALWEHFSQFKFQTWKFAFCGAMTAIVALIISDLDINAPWLWLVCILGGIAGALKVQRMLAWLTRIKMDAGLAPRHMKNLRENS